MSDSVQPHRWQPTRLLCPWDSPGKNEEMDPKQKQDPVVDMTGDGSKVPCNIVKDNIASEPGKLAP